MAEVRSDDPITSKSLSFPLLVSSVVLMLTLAWALYDEMYGLRPWRSYQRRFVAAYGAFLEKEIPKQRAAEAAIRESGEYQQFEQQLKAAMEAARPRLAEIDERVRYLDRRLVALTPTFTVARGQVTALIYELEIASSPSSAQRRLRTVEEAKKGPFAAELPTPDGKTERKSFTYDEIEAEFNGLRDERARLVVTRAEVERSVKDVAEKRDAYFREKLLGLTAGQLATLLDSVRRAATRIRQINVEHAGLVDRCQSCHLGMDPKLVPPNLTLTKAALGLAESKDAPFSSHPNPELLRIHDPERFGCSPCHGGNGRATSGIVKGHGRHKYWLWPLYYPENYQAGCQQCHAADMVLEHAPVLNHGKELFRSRGCIGCHRFEGFDSESEQLLSARLQIRQLEQQKKEYDLEILKLQKEADDPNTDTDTARKLNERVANIPVLQSGLDAQIEQLDRRAASLMREEKKVGPSLKEVRMKLRKEWIPVWLKETHAFRPATKMPQFRLGDDEIRAIAAFIWQSGVAGTLVKHPPGNAARGKELVETRGCLGCHSLDEGAQQRGGDFAANLSRVGEKANYDYLVRWVHNPRERTRPYCPYEKRDLGPEDYTKHGLPYVFDLEHPKCPNDGHQLQVQQQTVMPSLRLTWEEARDIASFLLTQKRADASYAAAAYLDDAGLKDHGRALVRHYGCAGCHEIATLEEEGRIGTELTTEGSKPIERLDFALLTEPAKRGHIPESLRDSALRARGKWYDQKGFFEAKLSDPAIYDEGKHVKQLKMPKPNLTRADIDALTTFLLGSVDQQLPREYLYKPGDARRDIQEGWWIVTKYNCMGCHQLQLGQKTALESLPWYQGENKDKLPPPLVGEGARVDPNWLARFLENPALSKTDLNRNGVRPYLQVRMPTFSFSENEIRKLVRFFEALSAQAQPYLPPKVEPVTDAERQVARALFTHPAAPCLKCHATGDPAHDRNASAPNFLLARERLRPAWTLRWMLDPARIAPGTAMPSGLFRREGDRWVFAGPWPDALQGYTRDHADLVVRYMFQLTPEEQRALSGRTAAASPPASGGASGPGSSR